MTNLSEITQVIEEVDNTVKEIVKKNLVHESNLFYLNYPAARMQITTFRLAVTETEVIMFNAKHTQNIL